jgi:hypothetical protein
LEICLKDGQQTDITMELNKLELSNKSQEYHISAQMSLLATEKLLKGNEKFAIVKAYLEKNIKISNIGVWEGLPPMHQAVEEGRWFWWCFLSFIGGDGDAPNGQGMSSINLIIKKIEEESRDTSNSNISKKLQKMEDLSYFTKLVLRSHLKSQKIHDSAFDGDERSIELLLNNEYDANRRDVEGKTALQLAAEKGHRNCVKLLLDYNAKDEGNRALQLAIKNDHPECVKLLQSNSANDES